MQKRLVIREGEKNRKKETGGGGRSTRLTHSLLVENN